MIELGNLSAEDAVIIELENLSAEDAVVLIELENLSAEDAEDAEYFWVSGFVYRNHFAIAA